MKFGDLLSTRSLKALFFCSVYLFVGPTLILVNNNILKKTGFHFPMALSAIGLVFSVVLSFILIKTGIVSSTKNFDITLPFYMKSILPVGLFMAGTLAAGNIVYLYLTVSFIQMLKSFTPTVTLAVMFSFGIEKPTAKLILAVFGISVGTAIAAYGELNFSLIGVAYMLSSELFEALRLVMTQILLTDYKFSVFEGLYYLAPASLFWMVVAIGFFELNDMIEANAFVIIQEHLYDFFVAGILGFLVNILAFFVLQVTSSVTLKVLATARNAGLVLFCAVFLSEAVTGIQFFGYSTSLLCFVWYNAIKMQASSATSSVTPVKPTA